MTEVDVARTMQDVVGRMPVPGAAWAVVSGPRQTARIGAAGPLRSDTIFRIASITKPIVAVLTMRLVDEGLFGLDHPVGRWLPEFAERRVLRERGAALDDTVPARRPTSVRDLLLMSAGFGWDATTSPLNPLAEEYERRGLVSAWQPPGISPDRWAELARPLPMAHHPGEGWLYQFSFDLLAVFLERVTRRRLDLVLRDKLFDPLGMKDTGYSVAMRDVDRATSAWFPNRRGDHVEVAPEADPRLMDVPVFRSAATGLVSTADDLAKFVQMLLRGGRGPRGTVVSSSSLAALTTDTLGEAASAMAHEFLEPDIAWGMGFGVDRTARFRGSHPGRFGWDGGTGTSLWVDPASGVGGVLLTRQGMGTPEPPEYLDAFWRSVHA
jgi:CubicO group peptidase (beta-lactamase class C family)